METQAEYENEKEHYEQAQEERNQMCEICGTAIIQDCGKCGAPNCCPKCCADTPPEWKSRTPLTDDMRELAMSFDMWATLSNADGRPKRCSEKSRR